MNIIISSGNSGLGRATVEYYLNLGYNVGATVRSLNAQESLFKYLDNSNIERNNLNIYYWDALDPYNIDDKFCNALENCDILVNNTGWEADLNLDRRKDKDTDLLSVSDNILVDAFKINAFAPKVLITKSLPFMIERDFGRIVNISSSLANFKNRIGELNAPAYRLSKNALNALTFEIASEFDLYNIRINAICPGWCKTRMGGNMAPDSVESGVEKIAFAVSIPPNGYHGKFLVNNIPV